MRLGAGAPAPTRPGGEVKTRDKCESPSETVPAPHVMEVALADNNITGERHKKQVEAEGNPVPGQRVWLYTDILPWLDTRYQDAMRDHRGANPRWRAGPITQAMERASSDRLRLYKEYKRKRIGDTELSTLQEK